MTEHWGGWPQDQPDFEGPDAGDPVDDGLHHPDDATVDPAGTGADYPVEGFGDADLDPYGEDPAGYPPADGVGDDPYAGVDPWVADAPWGEEALPDGEVGFGPADGLPESGTEVPAEVGFGPADPPVGADPDLDPYGDPAQWPPTDPGPVEGFGPAPEPVDGFPWADPDLLGPPGDGPAPDPSVVTGGTPRPDELAEYAAADLPDDGDPWSALAASDDPATSALARFWGPAEDR
ncbi:hypothetical protein [Micromonospora sp. HM5-17]|jgi:hypothetical protein|uniref:hypothetical protein n=1 Tax=Micromonospora sp. HM5-17 TaxID=2487710 RepID=UPI000F48EB20|nr:hypothetical protein [Micromonospora sp. HM5-17]ROT29556.1 hypothetical protein EF879_18005 [Micromonospora sp. HM5-17]